VRRRSSSDRRQPGIDSGDVRSDHEHLDRRRTEVTHGEGENGRTTPPKLRQSRELLLHSTNTEPVIAQLEPSAVHQSYWATAGIVDGILGPFAAAACAAGIELCTSIIKSSKQARDAMYMTVPLWIPIGTSGSRGSTGCQERSLNQNSQGL
jgi:hypothetical protein